MDSFLDPIVCTKKNYLIKDEIRSRKTEMMNNEASKNIIGELEKFLENTQERKQI